MATAVEFFSGIGAFAQAAHKRGVKVIAAFDQSQIANEVYAANHGQAPSTRNLDSVSKEHVPAADIWWMSPPCTPYSRRGKQADENDPRANSLKNLIEIFKEKVPQRLFLENVSPFVESKMFQRMKLAMEENGYSIRLYELCPTMFGVPMKRPRVFIAASKVGSVSKVTAPSPCELVPLRSFLEEPQTAWRRDAAAPIEDRYIGSLNIVDAEDPAAIAICFTSGYGRSYKASGSFLRTADGARRFSPKEIANLMGFHHEFTFPPDITIEEQWRLLGNSVEARCIEWVLQKELG